jgi:hypothetical protein
MSRIIEIGVSSQIEVLTDRLKEADIKTDSITRVDLSHALVIDEGSPDSFTLRFCIMESFGHIRPLRPGHLSRYCSHHPTIILMGALLFPTPGVYNIYDLLIHVYTDEVVLWADKETIISPYSTWSDLETLRSLADKSTKTNQALATV